MDTRFEALLQDAAREMGRDLGDLSAVRAYAAQRALHLSTLVDQPGYELAIRAERNNVAAELGLDVTASADKFDQRLVGLIQGALAMWVG